MDIKHIGNNVTKLRLARGLTQEALGREIGLTPSAISNIEKSTSYPSIDTLIRLADFFGVTLDYLSSDKYSRQLDELEIKAKLLTTEQFLRKAKKQSCSYRIGDKAYCLEEDEFGLRYKVVVNKTEQGGENFG